MKKFVVASLIFLAQVSSAESNFKWVLNPANVPESVMYFAGSRVTDHRVDPPTVTYVYSPAMKPYSQAGVYSHMTITSLAGPLWDGSSEGYVTLRILGLNQCLTNPATYRGQDTGKLLWQLCKDQRTGGVEALRQAFYVKKNQNGLVKLASHMQYTLGVPNAKPECLERRTPTEVVRVECSGLHNWMLLRK